MSLYLLRKEKKTKREDKLVVILVSLAVGSGEGQVKKVGEWRQCRPRQCPWISFKTHSTFQSMFLVLTPLYHLPTRCIFSMTIGIFKGLSAFICVCLYCTCRWQRNTGNGNREIFLRLLYSILLHLPSLPFHCVGECLDLT